MSYVILLKEKVDRDEEVLENQNGSDSIIIMETIQTSIDY